MKSKYSEDVKERAKELRKLGNQWAEISRQLDVPSSTIKTWAGQENWEDAPLIGLPEDPLGKLKEQILKLTKNVPETPLLDILKATNSSYREVEQAVNELHSSGYDVKVSAQQHYINRVLQAPHGKTTHLFDRVKNSKILRVGVIADNQLGNFKSRLDVLQTAYEHFESEGVTNVYHAGNMIDGFAKRINFNELIPEAGYTIDSQTEYAAKVYPQKKNITTYFITGECFSNDTEVLTRKGFIRFDELCVNDTPPVGIEVATLNLDTGSMEWHEPTAWWKKQYNGDMLHFENNKIDLLVTPEHEMLSRRRSFGEEPPGPWERTLAKDWKPNAQRQFIKCFWGTQGEDPKEINGYRTEDWAEFMGWWLSEGWVDGDRVAISQKKSSCWFTEIEDLLDRMGINATFDRDVTWRWRDPKLSKYLSQFGKAKDKFIPEDIKRLSPEHKRLFINALFKGDGNFINDHPTCYYTSSPKLRDDVVEVLISAGYGTKTTDLEGVVGKLFPGNKTNDSAEPEYRVYASKNKFAHYRGTPKKVSYSGTVYCLNVKNEIIVTRRNGKVTINTRCHEGWWERDSGINVGRAMQLRFDEFNRNDLVCVGHIEADVELRTKDLKDSVRGPIMRIMHPGSGTAYALSYKSQKIAESLQGGEKPQIHVIGHYHKFDYNYHREIHNILAGTTCDQTVFMRKRQIPAHVGYLILEIKINTFDGIIEELGVRWKPFYDKGFYDSWRK